MAESMDMVEPKEMVEDGDSTSMYGTLAAFEMDKKIGKGQFSEVYRVVCKATSKVLALKKVQVGCYDLFSVLLQMQRRAMLYP